jgi:hypothetical protein
MQTKHISILTNAEALHALSLCLQSCASWLSGGCSSGLIAREEVGMSLSGIEAIFVPLKRLHSNCAATLTSVEARLICEDLSPFDRKECEAIFVAAFHSSSGQSSASRETSQVNGRLPPLKITDDRPNYEWNGEFPQTSIDKGVAADKAKRRIRKGGFK